MADLSVANAVAQITAVIDFLDEAQKFGGANSPNWQGLEDTLRGTSAGNYRDSVLSAVQGARANLAAILARGTGRAMIAPCFLDLMDAIGKSKAGGLDAMVARFYQYLDDNSETFAAREFTFDGSPSAGGSNVGDGTLHRVTVDRNNYELANAFAESKEFRCEQDQKSGASRFREVFRVRGAEANRDGLADKGSGVDGLIRCLDERDSASLLVNPGFDIGDTGTPSSTTSVRGWTLDATTSVDVSTAQTWRTPDNVSTAKSLKLSANRTVYQILDKQDLRRDVPYLFHVAIYRASSADGTLTVSVGGVSRAITLSGLTDDAWNVVTIPATLGQNCYYDQIAEDQADVRFAWTSRTTGDIYIDGIIFAPMTLVDGTFYAITAGATPWQVEDTLTITDTGGTSGVMAEWLAKLTGVSFPTTTGVETYSDP